MTESNRMSVTASPDINTKLGKASSSKHFRYLIISILLIGVIASVTVMLVFRPTSTQAFTPTQLNFIGLQADITPTYTPELNKSVPTATQWYVDDPGVLSNSLVIGVDVRVEVNPSKLDMLNPITVTFNVYYTILLDATYYENISFAPYIIELYLVNFTANVYTDTIVLGTIVLNVTTDAIWNDAVCNVVMDTTVLSYRSNSMPQMQTLTDQYQVTMHAVTVNMQTIVDVPVYTKYGLMTLGGALGLGMAAKKTSSTRHKREYDLQANCIPYQSCDPKVQKCCPGKKP